MTTNDKKNNYVFQLKKDKLIFQKNDSSAVTLINREIGVEITDNAIFILSDN